MYLYPFHFFAYVHRALRGFAVARVACIGARDLCILSRGYGWPGKTLDSRMRTMLTRGTLFARGLTCAVAALVVVLAAGCTNQPKPKRAADAAQAAPSEAVTPVQGLDAPAREKEAAPKADQMEASAGTADALARKAESYSREMGPLLATRRSAPQ